MTRRLITFTATLALALAGGGTAAAAKSLHWSGPIDLEDGQYLMGISCPSAGLCVAGASNGVLVSTNPAGGPSVWHLAFTPPAPANGYAPAAYSVSCPSVSLCVGASLGGGIFYSSNPTGGPGAWHFFQTPVHAQGEGSVAYCQSTSLCFAFVVTTRELFTSTNPTAGPRSWKQSRFRYPLNSIGCADTHLCLLGTSGPYADLLITTHPTAPPRSWRDTRLYTLPVRGGGIATGAVGCTSGHACYAATLCGNCGRAAISSTDDPTGGNKAWFPFGHLHPLAGRLPVTSGSCLPGKFCMFASGDGRVYKTDGLMKFSSTRVRRTGFRAISCASASFCAAVGDKLLNIGTG